jgi:hypothetical protein
MLGTAMPLAGFYRAVKTLSRREGESPAVSVDADVSPFLYDAMAVVDAEFVDCLPEGQDGVLVTNVVIVADRQDAAVADDNAALLWQAVQAGNRPAVLRCLALMGRHEETTVQRVFNDPRNDTAMLVLCQDAGLDYPQSCQLMQKVGYVRCLRRIEEAAVETMRGFLVKNERDII